MRTALDAIKRSRQKLGAKNTVTYVSSTASSYDASLVLTPAAATGGFSITFTALKQAYADAELSFRVFCDSLSNELHPGDTLWPYAGVYSVHTVPSGGGMTYQWNFTLYNPDSVTHTYYVKCSVVATDRGTVVKL